MSSFLQKIVGFLFISIIILPIKGFGQTSEGVGINTTTIDPHSVLHIENTYDPASGLAKGLKLPTYSQSELSNLETGGSGTLTKGLLFFSDDDNQIFNTTTVNGDNVIEPIGWGMHGNAVTDLTNAANFFLGTKDAMDFEIATDNTTRMFFSRTGEIVVGDPTGYTNDASFQINTSTGLLLPRITEAQRLSITDPTPGLIVYDRDYNEFYGGFYNPQTGAREWEALDRGGGGGSGGSDADWTIGSGKVYNTTDIIGIGTSSPNTDNLLGVAGGVAIGSSYASTTTTAIDGLNVEGNVGIGTEGTSGNQLYLKSTVGEHTRGINNYQFGSPRANSTGYGIYNDVNMSTSSAVYGIYNKVYSAGTSHKYGIYNYAYGNSASSGLVYGINQYVYHDGTGDAYGIRLQNNGAGSGIDYGIYSTGEDINYFEGEMRIGASASEGKLQVDQTGTDPIVRFRKSTTTQFMVANNGYTALYYNLTPSYKLQLNTNSAAKPTSSAWTVASDERLKKDVSNFNDGLDVLMKINPVWFNYTGEAGMPVNERGVGTIAQDLQKIAPYMVSEWTYVEGSTDETRTGNIGTETKYLGVDYGALDFVLINSVQEQQEIIKAQNENIETLEETVQKLTANQEQQLMIEAQQKMIESQQKEINLLKIDMEQLKKK